MPTWNPTTVQGINPGLLQQSTVARNPRAAGLDALTSGLSPAVNGAISQMIQSGQLKKIIAAMNQPQSSGAMGNQQFPQGQPPQQGQAPAPQMNTPGTSAPQPFAQSMAKNTGMYNGPLSMGGNDPLGLFS